MRSRTSGILSITAGFWALALWPLTSAAPDWVVRTREICFCGSRDGLPHAGGWVLLVGEPVGMVLFLVAAWGYELREGLTRLWGHWSGRGVLAAVIVLVGMGAGAASVRVTRLRGDPFDPTSGRDPALAVVPIGEPAPALGLIDQRGRTTTLASLRGHPVVITFVYAHCETVCPIMVHDVLAASAARAIPVLVTLAPWRDTPSRLPNISDAWSLPPEARLLSGEVEQVEFVLDRWKVPRVRNAVTGEVIHPRVRARRRRTPALPDGCVTGGRAIGVGRHLMGKTGSAGEVLSAG